MSAREIELDRLLGMRVVDPRGKTVGHIEEVRARKTGSGVWEMVEYHIGTAALLERLSARMLRFPRSFQRGYAAAWDQLEISTRNRARLLCPVEDLRRITRHAPGSRSKRTKGGRG